MQKKDIINVPKKVIPQHHPLLKFTIYYNFSRLHRSQKYKEELSYFCRIKLKNKFIFSTVEGTISDNIP